MNNNQIKFILEDAIANSFSKDNIQANTGDRYIKKSFGGEEIILTIILGLVTNGLYDLVKSKALNAIKDKKLEEEVEVIDIEIEENYNGANHYCN